MNQIELAESICRMAHEGQFRRDGTTPYSDHPCAVARNMAGHPPYVIAAAYLHDVVEDTAETLESLRTAGIVQQTLDLVELLTKKREQPYKNYLRRIKTNPEATEIKIQDILHNLSDNPPRKQILKYADALVLLLS